MHPSLQGKVENKENCDTPKPIVSVNERVNKMEAAVLGFLAENNLSFSLTPHFIDFFKLSRDEKALHELHMDRTTASYKMTYGVGKTFTQNMVDVLKTSKFSLNIDEATSENFIRVLAVLVSYICPINKQVVVNHLGSLDSATLFNELEKLIESNEIPWSNLMSVLMNSCSVMRGSKSGLEARIREKAPHLLDIDGDSCHHVHNAT